MKTSVLSRLVLVAGAFSCGSAFASAETDWSTKSGAVTIPAGETWVADQADMAYVNALTSITVSGPQAESAPEAGDAKEAAKLVFRNCTTTPKKDLLLGPGTVEKTGSDAWTMSVSQANFTGDFVLSGGVVTDAGEKSFGSTANGCGKLYVKDGASLYFDSTTPKFVYREVRIAGAGSVACPAAIYIKSARKGLFYLLSLDADATIYVASGDNHYWVGNQGKPRDDNTGSSIIDLQDYTLTRSGPMAFYSLGLTLKGTGKLVIPDAGSAVFRESSSLSTGITELPGNIGVQFYNKMNTIHRPLVIKGSATFAGDGNSTYIYIPGTNGNNYAGPVTLDGASSRMRFSVHKYSDTQIVISGDVSGSGAVVQNENVKGRNVLSGHNTYTGGTFVHGLGSGRLAAFWHDSIPDYSNTTVDNAGALVVQPGLSGETERWPKAKIFEALNTMNFSTYGHLAIDADYCEDSTYELSLAELNDSSKVTAAQPHLSVDGGTFRITSEAGDTGRVAPSAIRGTLELSGPGVYTLAGTNEVNGFKGGLAGSGTVKVTDGATVRQGPGVQMLLGARTAATYFSNEIPVGRLVVTNASWITSVEESVTGEVIDDVRSGAIYIGSKYAGVMDVENGGVVTNKINLGGGDTFSGGDGAGALYVKKGGEVYTKQLAKLGHIASRIGQAGFGYVEVNGGTFGADFLRLGGYAGPGGMLSIYGGGQAFSDAHLDISGCNHTDGVSVLNVFDGTCTMKSGDFTLCAGGSGTRSEVNVCGSNAVLTILGSRRAYVQSNPDALWTHFTLADGGRINCHMFAKYKATSEYKKDNPCPLVMSFNGGVVSDGDYYDSSLFSDGPSKRVDVVAIYEKGMIIDAVNRPITQSTYVPFEGKREGGIQSIAFGEPVTGLFAPPIVTVSGDGHAATVVADWDPETRVLKGLKILARGWGYKQGAVTVTLKNGMWSKTFTGDSVTVGENEIGGFTARGTSKGSVTLNSETNSWAKWTRIEGTKLKIGAKDVVPAGTELQFMGGTLDVNNLGDDTPTFCSLSGTGGTVLNGAVKLVGTDGVVDISVKQFLSGASCNLTGTLDLTDVTAIRLTDTELLTEEATKDLRSKNLFSATTIVNWDNVAVTGVPDGWRVIKTANALRICPPRGLLMILR